MIKIILGKFFQTMIQRFSSCYSEDWKRFGIYETVWNENEIISEQEWEEIRKLLDELEKLDKLEKLEKLDKKNYKKGRNYRKTRN